MCIILYLNILEDLISMFVTLLLLSIMFYSSDPGSSYTLITVMMYLQFFLISQNELFCSEEMQRAVCIPLKSDTVVCRIAKQSVQ